MAWSALQSIHFAVICAVAGIVVTSAEALWHWSKGHYDAGGIWPWGIAREAYSARVGAVLTPLMSNRGMLVIHGARIAGAGAVLLAYAEQGSALVPLSVLIATHCILQLRSRWGGEGADQMTILVLIAGLLADSLPDPRVATSVALFIGGQITLSYLASGGAKLFGAKWRNGTALGEIMNQHTYGHPWLSRFLRQYPLIGKAACRLVIGFQISFLAFYLLPMPYALIYPAGGVLFHAGIAYFMRLNLFFLTFIGTYPCLMFTHQVVHHFLIR